MTGQPEIQRSVLIVEDDKFNRQIFEDVLSVEYHVITTASGEAAMEVLRNADVDAILADQILPEMEGLQVLEHARKIHPTTARILITASNRIEDARDAINVAKVHGVLLKPVRPLELLAMVGSALREVSLESQLQRIVAEVSERNELLTNAFAQLEAHEQRVAAEVSKRTEDLRRTIEQLEGLALRDGLTGLFNHRYFQDVLASEIARAGRHSRKLALLFLDVDHFKAYNDTFGHPAGDVLLRELAGIITNVGQVPQVRARGRISDIACRYGGEEFVVILPEADKRGGSVRAERLREAVEAHRFGDRPAGAVTVSIGVAAFPEDATSKPQLVEAADRALFAAKRQGRNRVVLAGA